MDPLLSMDISIKLSQFVGLILLTTLAFLYGRIKIALMINYAFFLYWIYFCNLNRFMQIKIHNFNAIFFTTGFLFVAVASMAYFLNRE